MKNIFITLAMLLIVAHSTEAQRLLTLTPFLQQTGMYYASDRITSDGLGLGLGLHALHRSGVAAQADVNLIWGNGNAVTTRLALGYQRKGRWNPGAFATLNLLWGQRVEILDEKGDPPGMPAWAAGIRITPLKFEAGKGFISALELGAGIGPAKAFSLEVTILSAGVRF